MNPTYFAGPVQISCLCGELVQRPSCHSMSLTIRHLPFFVLSRSSMCLPKNNTQLSFVPHFSCIMWLSLSCPFSPKIPLLSTVRRHSTVALDDGARSKTDHNTQKTKVREYNKAYYMSHKKEHKHYCQEYRKKKQSELRRHYNNYKDVLKQTLDKQLKSENLLVQTT